MSYENPQNIIRSWNDVQSFNTGPVYEDKLAPVDYGRIETLFTQTWREEKLSNTLDWGAQSFSVYLPESLQVISSAYLKIDLPALGADSYKKYPGIFALKTLRLLSNGAELYTCDCNLFFHDYLESLSEEGLHCISSAYFGTTANLSPDARTIMIPIMLPNSQYLGRTGDNKGHGIFPCFLGNATLELQITLNEAGHVATSTSSVPASIAGACSMMYHEVQMSESIAKTYADLRGNYSIVNRRFTELTNGWTEYTSAGAKVNINQYQPQGAITEVMVIAVPNNADETRHGTDYVLPDSLKVTADSICQKDLNTPQKVKAELWTNGFCPPVDFPSPGRLCFAVHAARADHVFSGAYNMQSASNVDFEFTFPTAVRYRVIASCLQRCSIDPTGKIRARLE